MKKCCICCGSEFDIIEYMPIAEAKIIRLEFIGEEAVAEDENGGNQRVGYMSANSGSPDYANIKRALSKVVDIDERTKVCVSAPRSIYDFLFVIGEGKYSDIIELKDCSCEVQKNEYWNNYFIDSIRITKGPKYEEWREGLSIVEKNETICPLCGGKLVGENDKEKQIGGMISEKLDKFMEECASKPSRVLECEGGDLEIIEYLRQITNIEKGIMYFSEQLKRLYDAEFKLKQKQIQGRVVSQKEAERAMTEYSQELSSITGYLDRHGSLPLDENYIRSQYSLKMYKKLVMPEKPAEKMPEEPTLAKPGVFNRKKVTEENELALKRYNEEMRKYKAAWAKYEEEVEAYRKNEECREAYEEEYQKAYQTELENIEGKKRRKAELEAKIDELKTGAQMVVADGKTASEEAILGVIQAEIEETESNLAKFIECKKELLSLNVIYSKYADFVSMMVILEYLESGRCDELKGPNGAYNLYESELRQNIIISKLDVIIESLEQIKQNQFLLYGALYEIKNDSERICDRLNDVVSAVDEVKVSVKASAEKLGDTLGEIAENTQCIAYYSEKNAQYSKRMCELTNALGYLIAFK